MKRKFKQGVKEYVLEVSCSISSISLKNKEVFSIRSLMKILKIWIFVYLNDVVIVGGKNYT